MGILYCQTTGAATNSGSTDTNAATLSGAAATVAASVVTLDGSPDLTGIVTSGAAQSSIYLNDASNANQKIFWITAADNGAKTVTVSVAPTGVTSSSWAIGGRVVHTPANFESTLRAGDIYQFGDSPAARTTTFYTARVSGDSTGKIAIRGKTGVRPVLNVTNTVIVLTMGAITNTRIENLELDQDGASGNAITATGAGNEYVNVKISDCGGIGLSTTAQAKVIGCEITGTGGVAILNSAAQAGAIIGNYIHDCASKGIELSSATPGGTVSGNIIDTCAGQGIHVSGAPTTQAHCLSIDGNTIYGCGDSGLEVADADTVIVLTNNIFSENGNAAGEFNVEWVAGAAENVSYHSNNVFFHSGGGGGANLSGITANSTELTTDPLFTNPGGGDFTLQSSSPAKATGFLGVFLGGPTGYLDIGAVQRQEAGGGGGSTGISRARAFGGFS